VKQVSFGYGIHLCIGASLARVETTIAFEILMQRYPDMSLVSKTPQWGTNPVFRGLERLEVRSGTVSEAAAA
jgi:cytochrome P450